ncbi:FliI/YscN family ATPase [Thalassoroseus pseudoceratinae]|uniref:FliI/YscN family ATPase n=1 Tax=Thalassoroseus pseudoceratinae TaxID=2713176 RepID=UPI00142240A5|nr:FliI/YscN family ATPase [Thalassoroseus pseudoceratinae]
MMDYHQQLAQSVPFGLSGHISRVVGLTASVAGFPAPLGAVCQIERGHGKLIDAEVVGFRDREALLLSYGDLAGVRRGNRVRLRQSSPTVRVGPSLLGRVIDARGRLIDGGPRTPCPTCVNLQSPPTPALERPRIQTPLQTGVRVIDGFLTCGVGQRLGIFAGSGVGKSTLLGQIAKFSSADVNVVTLVGERGREVREFLERDLGPEGLARSVVIVATGDEPALLRLRAAYLGTAIAEYFRDLGKNVLLMMDSVTRFALAGREIGLAAGEPPATRGYPPSVFSILPRLLERSGLNGRGSITGLYTVLVEGDDTNEPVSDAVRGILDGHVMLSRKLAHQSHWPAVDVLQSISRSMNDLVIPQHRQAAYSLRGMLAARKEAEDLIAVGAYRRGSDVLVDQSLQMDDAIRKFLHQSPTEQTPIKQSIAELCQLETVRASLPRMDAKKDSTAKN